MTESVEEKYNTLQRVVFIITEECNNKCVHCYNSFLTRRHGFMSKEIFDLALKKTVKQGVKSVCLSGGEALLHPDIIYFIKQIKKCNLHLRLYTNGQNITTDLCDVLEGMDLSPVSVTLYSSNKEIHDSITQSSGSLEKTIAGIEMLTKHNIPVQISIPVTKGSISGFKNLFYFCKSNLNISSFGPNPFISYTVNHNHTNASAIPSIEDIREFAKIYYCLAIEHGFNIIPHIDRNKGNVFHLYDGAELTIQYDGSIVAGTLLSDITLGNIRSDELCDLWDNSPLLKKWRRYILEENDKCAHCDFLSLCQPNIGDNWVANHDMLQLDTHWCESNKEYYTCLFDWSDGGKFLVEVNNKHGFVFSPKDIFDKDGIKYAKAFFSYKIAKLKYSMTDSECKELSMSNIYVQFN